LKSVERILRYVIAVLSYVKTLTAPFYIFASNKWELLLLWIPASKIGTVNFLKIILATF
jgi:hypothetical protein